MLASSQARHVYLAPGLYEKTGSLAMATGLFRVRMIADPRLFGEHRSIQEFVRLHEGAHIALRHVQMLAVAKWMTTMLVGALAAIACAASQSVPLVLVAGFVAAWCEAKFQFLTLWFRAQCEAEADALALTAMRPHAFATAVKTLDQGRTKPTTWWGRVQERSLNGRDYRERLERVGLSEAP